MLLKIKAMNWSPSVRWNPYTYYCNKKDTQYVISKEKYRTVDVAENLKEYFLKYVLTCF